MNLMRKEKRMNARITLIGIENELNALNKSITDTWVCEYGDFDKDVLLSSIITTGATFEPIYTDPIYFYDMCGYWWKKWKSTINKWFDAFSKEYEPLWDRNGYEEVHEDTTDVGTNDTDTVSKEIMDDDTTIHTVEVMDDDTSAHTENKVSAYNQSTYQPHDESTSQGTDDRTTTTDSAGTDDKTTDFTSTIDNDSTNDRDFDRTYHSWGNWGISQTSQKLLEQEFNIRKINLYNKVADLFCSEMLVRVY